MRYVANCICKDVEERNIIVKMLQMERIIPVIDGLKVEVDYDIVEGSWPLYVTSIMDKISAIFELVENHEIRYVS